MKQSPKEIVKAFWDQKPCGTMGNIPFNPGLDYFERIKQRRYKLEPFIKDFAQFEKWQNKRVLEIGCGIGIDATEFVKAGTDYTGVDLSGKSLALAKKYFQLKNLKANLIQADSENLPFQDSAFDFIFSWGVIHHAPDIKKVISEISRVLKPGGQICLMIYNRLSLVGLQLWLVYGLAKLRPFISLKELFSRHHESSGTQAFTKNEAMDLFKDFKNLKINTVVTPYDLRISRNRFLPDFFQKLIPKNLGFFTIIQGQK